MEAAVALKAQQEAPVYDAYSNILPFCNLGIEMAQHRTSTPRTVAARAHHSATELKRFNAIELFCCCCCCFELSFGRKSQPILQWELKRPSTMDRASTPSTDATSHQHCSPTESKWLKIKLLLCCYSCCCFEQPFRDMALVEFHMMGYGAIKNRLVVSKHVALVANRNSKVSKFWA